MSKFNRYNNQGVRIEEINLLRATLNEAKEIRDNLIEDVLVFKKIIVDLSMCEYIDSTFCGALVFAFKYIKEQGGNIKLVMSNPFMKSTFIFKDIERVFEVYDTIDEAVRVYQNNGKEIFASK